MLLSCYSPHVMWVGVNAVTHKSFYEAATAEVAAGRLDNALWIKVNAELPGADNSVRQAKYIALRAQELAVEAAAYKMRRWVPHSFWSWVAYLAAAFVVAVIVGNILGAIGDLSATFVPLGIVIAVMAAAILLAIHWTRAANGATQSAEAPSNTRAR